MTKPKAKQPLESFDPRLMQLLIAGARSRIIIPFLGEAGKKRAHNFQRRLHTLRARMRQENHEHSTLVSRCVSRLFWGSSASEQGLVNSPEWISDDSGLLGAYLVVEPTDAQFDDVLSALKLGGPVVPPLVSKTLSSDSGDLSLEEIFGTLEGRSAPEGKK